MINLEDKSEEFIEGYEQGRKEGQILGMLKTVNRVIEIIEGDKK